MYSYSLGLYEKAFPEDMPLSDKLAHTRECGFDHMELCVDTVPSREKRIYWSREERRTARMMSEDAGVPFTTFSLSMLRNTPLGLPDDSLNLKALDVLKRGAELAVYLGARVMLINGYDVYGEPSTPVTRARFMENLPKAAAVCERAGLMMGIENAEQEFCFSVERAMEIVSALPSPYLGIYADMGNSANSTGGDADASMRDIRIGADRIFAMHIKDTLPGEYRYTPYGAGHVDFNRAIALSKELRIRLFTAELFMRPGVEPILEAKRVNAFIRGYFDKEDS